MDETRQIIANLLVSNNPADHARAREMHARLRQLECSYVCSVPGEIGAVFFIEPESLTVTERCWMTLWTICCFAGVGLAAWAIALGFVALFNLISI